MKISSVSNRKLYSASASIFTQQISGQSPAVGFLHELASPNDIDDRVLAARFIQSRDQR